MSRTVQRIASRTLLSVTLIFLLTQAHVFGQTYTWRNVQIFGGGFIVGVVFNQTEANLVKVLSVIIASPTTIVGRGERLPQRLKARSDVVDASFNDYDDKELKLYGI